MFALILQAQGQPSLFAGPLMILAMVAIFYFLVIMPSQRHRKRHATMLTALQAGNVVQTTGGIVGTIVSVNDDTLVIRVKPDNIKLEVARSAIAGVLSEK